MRIEALIIAIMSW